MYISKIKIIIIIIKLTPLILVEASLSFHAAAEATIKKHTDQTCAELGYVFVCL